MTPPGSDFEKVRSKRYKAWRIVRTPAIYMDAYKQRIQKIGNYRSAILFPEQLLNLSQSQIWKVTDQKTGMISSVTIIAMNNFDLFGDHKSITTAQQVFDFESFGSGELCVGDSYSSKNFIDILLFTNKRDAVKYASIRLEANLQ